MRTHTFLSTILLAAATCAQPTYMQHTDAFCGLSNGTAAVTGNIAGCTFLWSTGETTQWIGNLAAGDYSVTVTDQGGGTEQHDVTIGTSSALPVTGYWFVSCGTGSCEGSVYVSTPHDEIAQPLTYSVDPPQCIFAAPDHAQFPWDPGALILNLEGGAAYTVTVTDANGCSGSFTDTVRVLGPDTYDSNWIWPVWSNSVDQIVPDCGGAGNGSFRVVAQNDWSNWELIGPDGTHALIWIDQPPYVFSGLSAGTYRVRRVVWGDNAEYLGNCEEMEVVIPANPEPCTGITGMIHHDADEDCAVGASDIELPYRVLTIEPGPIYAFSGADGSYWKDLPYGSYTIQQTLTDEEQVCPPNAQEPFDVTPGTPLANVDLYNLSTAPHDLSVLIWGNTPVVGFPTWVSIKVTNNSAFFSGDVTIDATYDPVLLDPQFSGPLALGTIEPYGSVTVVLTAMLPPDIDLLGEPLVYSVVVNNTAGEPNTANNTATLEQTIVSAYDPNDKLGATSSRISDSHYFIDQDEWIVYTVRFQNTGTTAAQTVVIRDTIDTDLDIPTIQILGASHAFAPSFGDGRELVFAFNGINLPDSGADYLGSQGFISYRIRPEEGIAPGDVIGNTAAIYFDFNPPIITNTVEHIVEFSTGSTDGTGTMPVIRPNPVHDVLNAILPEGTFGLRVHAADGRWLPLVVRSQGRSVQIDLSGSAPGVYFLHTSNGVLRFVKD